MTFGDRICKAREARGWSQRQLAKVSGVDHARISRLESGERALPSMDAGIKIARALGIGLDHLVGTFDEDMKAADVA